MLRARDASGNVHVITRMRVRDGGNVLRDIQTLRARDGASIQRVVFQAYSNQSLVANPNYVYGSGYSRGFVNISTEFTTVSVSAGSPPYTHSWTGPVGWSISNPTGATTLFRIGASPGQQFSGTFTDTVTDSTGHTATVTVDALVENTYEFS